MMKIFGSKKNGRLGTKGENLAVKYLKRRGYKILTRNYVTPFGEVDVIAEKGDCVVFAEVKTRTEADDIMPSQSVGAEKRRKYILCAKYWLAHAGRECIVRFDVIEVVNKNINHIENAFTA